MSIWNGTTGQQDKLSANVAGIKAHMAQNRVASAEIARGALSMEALRDDQINTIMQAKDSLESLIQGGLGIEKPTAAMVKAGVVAGLISGDMRAFANTPVMENRQDMIVPVGPDFYTERNIAVEAFDESNVKDMSSYSVAYNISAARQDEFGEAFFPTVTVSPDQIGVEVTARILTVFDDNKHNVNGSLTNFNHKNLLRAYRDPSVLKSEMTRVIPVMRAGAEANFVDAADVAPYVANLEGEEIPTSALKAGATINLLGLSQTEALLSEGMADKTDSIDPAVVLRRVYLKVGTGTDVDVLSFDTANFALSNFISTGQSNYRLMTLNFKTNSLLLNKNSKKVDGGALEALAPVVSGDLIVRLSMTVTGNIDLETGETSVFGNQVSVHSISNNNRELISLTSGAGLAIADLIKSGVIIGYDLKAYRSNLNRRQIGQLIHTNYVTQKYAVPLRAPISARRAVTSDSSTDTSDLNALIMATNIRTSNAAVTALLDAANLLNDVLDARDGNEATPEILGVSRDLIRPQYMYESIDVDSAINSVSSHERSEDIQAVLVNKLRDMVYSLYRNSEYRAFADSIKGGNAGTPTVIIGTDPVIARYLTVTGDLRTLGNEFDVRIVTTLDERVQGKIFVGFGNFSSGTNSAVDPLHFGNMLYKPTVTFTMPISRNGRITRELSVSPAFLHITNLPIMGVVEVSGITESLSRVPVHFKQLP